MKGFGIEIKNDLLEPKHIRNMGSSVWLYMWLLDKITSTTEDGIGRVLGGKPVKYNDVKKELGISQDTYTKWIKKLLKYPYIHTTRTPYGISFFVIKAFKRFGRRIRLTSELDSAKPRNHYQSDSAKPRNVIKTVSVRDNTKDRDFKSFSKEEALKRLIPFSWR